MLIVKGIMSYPTLFTPRKATEDGDPRYSVNVLMPKNDPQIAQIQTLIDVEIRDGLKGNLGKGSICLKDCDIEYPENQQVHGYMELRCSASVSNKPGVINFSDRQPVMDPSLVYGGAEAYIAVNIKAYNRGVSKGVTAYINGVMITGKEGALGRLDNRKTAEEIFEAVPATAPVQTPAATPPPTAPSVPPAPPTAPAIHEMTEAAGGQTYEAYINAGWTDELLIQHGLMVVPSL